jgi:hypothetical protein
MQGNMTNVLKKHACHSLRFLCFLTYILITSDAISILVLILVFVFQTTPPFGHPSNGGEFAELQP